MKNINNVIAINAILIGCRVTFVVGGVLACGCGQQHPGLTVIAGIDASSGWRDHLGQGVLCLAAQAQTMDAARDHLAAYRVANTTAEFTGEGALDDPDRFEAEVIRDVKARPGVGGTYPAAFWSAAADRADQTDGPCIVEIASDGDNDDGRAETRAELRRLGARLGANHRITGVWFLGITAENRAYWRDVFSPLGKRLHFYSPDQMTSEHAVAALRGT